ncbi:Protein FAR-RED ELONGATED HYPOCOTYL [Arachis hypogaea]|uniref:Protein FAR1-RELATED SEQUENCE n=1 Tax=Arachis hypogaea TaxID=3818 RepID=A0A6B9V532_ARAHY|nr:Protein FAR-RED ELONGATED HYPOCOTYL [Arachis hypogaea]
MDHSTSDCQLNPGEVDYEFESNEVPEPVYLQFMALKPLSVVDDELVPKVGMTFTTLEDAGKFYRNYAKAAGLSTRVWCTNRKGNEIKNQLITCSREGKWKSEISPTEKTNLIAGLNCPARIYIHTLKDVGAWIISKVVLDHSHPCCLSKAEMLKQHRKLSMSIRRTIENNEEADLYEHRHIWVPIYLDHHFWVGMRSTQRSESMHSFFNKYITWNSSLIQFIKQYDNYLGSREQAERESDAADFHTVIPCATKSSIEAQFQDAYTHAKFREVQAQLRGKANCITRLKNSSLGYSVYEVGEQVSSSIFNKFVVTYNSVAAEVKCQCLLFESRGILCRHALSVLSFEQVSQVSPRYILERWSKKVKRRHTHIKSSHDEPLMEPRSKRFDQLVFRSQNICEFASESEELTAILHRAYDNVMAEMESLKAKRKGTSSLSHEDGNPLTSFKARQGFEQEDIQKIG